VNPCPREPGNYPAQPDPPGLKDCEPRSDDRHIPFIEISKRPGGRLTKQALNDTPTCIPTLLNRHLGDTRQWFPVLLERSRISNYIYVGITGNREIVLNANAAGAVRLHVQPFTSWRRSHSCGPDHDLACDGSAQQSVRVLILRSFLKSDEFGLGGSQALRLQQQIVQVSVTAAAAEESFDVAIHGFYNTHRHLGFAVVQDSFQMVE